jgi:hypothetical protein
MPKLSPILLVCMVLAALSFRLAAAAPPDDGSPTRPYRYIYNCDADNMFIYKDPPMRPADVHPYIDQVAAAGVTSFFMSPNDGMVMNFPSRHARMLGDEDDPTLVEQIETEGREKPGTLSRAALNYRGFVGAGTSAMEIAVERARQQNMETFLSFRMNEVHWVNRPDVFPYNLIISKFWREHPQWWIGKPGDELSPLHKEILGPRTSPVVAAWLPGGLDFAVPQVRKRRLDQIRECCERFPIDGLDLDFQRFPMFFKYGHEEKNIAVMTQFVSDIRAMTRQIGKQRGRPMLLSARIMARPEQNRALGLDPFAWAREGLVDLLVASHYLRNDFPLPIKEYRDRLPETFPLYASIEVEPEPGTYRRLARALYDEGADGLLMFNYFTRRESGNEPDFKLLAELARPETIPSDN